VSYEEDTCVSYEEEDTRVPVVRSLRCSSGRRRALVHLPQKGRFLVGSVPVGSSSCKAQI
jgi:hypothetical protein